MAFAAMVAGCQIPEAVEPQYVPGEADNAFCYGVSFPKQDAAGSHSFDPEAEKVITLTAKRTNTFGDVTVPVEVIDTAGVFTVAPIEFADGQEETTFKVTFPTAKVGVKYGATIDITNTEYASIYGQGAKSISFDVLIVTWIDFLNPVTKEPAVFTISHPWSASRGEGHATMKYYEVGGVRTCAFTSIDKDDDGNPVGIWHGDPIANFTARWYVADLPSATDASKKLSHKNSEGNDFVEFVTQYIGYDYNDGDWQATATPAAPINGYDWFWYWNMRGYSIDELYGSWLDDANIEGSPDEGYPLGYYDGNGGFFFQLYYYIPGLGGWSPSGYTTVALADGFDRTDYSIALETDYSADGKTPVYVETGKDVTSIKYAVYPGELTSTQALNKAPLIADGTDESVEFTELVLDEDEGIKYATLELAPETTGLYTVVAVTFGPGEKGVESKDAAYVIINHVAAEDVEDNKVKVSAFTEDTPARYKELHDYDSFAYGISGENLTEVHVALYEEATISKYGSDAVLADAKETADYAVSSEILAKINADGGYYDVFKGLKAATTYYLVVWATNGNMDDYAIDSYTTAKLPYVWNSLGKGTLTDGFFVSLFSKPDYTVPCDVYQEANDPGLYMITGYQLPLVSAFFGQTEETMAAYEGANWNNTQLVIDAHDPAAVFIAEQDYGVCVNSSYGFVLIDTEQSGTLVDGVIKFPTKEMYVGLGGSWYYGNSAGTFEIRFPEAVEPAPAPVLTSTGRVEDAKISLSAEPFSRPVVVYEREAKSVKVSATVSYERNPNRGESLIAKKGPSVK